MNKKKLPCFVNYKKKRVLIKAVLKLYLVLPITTTTTYKLPFFLGGTVNLGLKEAKAVLAKTGAKLVLATHDQQKESKGLVGLFARPVYEYDDTFKSLNAGDSLALT